MSLSKELGKLGTKVKKLSSGHDVCADLRMTDWSGIWCVALHEGRPCRRMGKDGSGRCVTLKEPGLKGGKKPRRKLGDASPWV